MAQPRRDQDDQDGDESRNDGPDQPCVTSCPPVVLGPAISPAAATRSPTDHDANPTPGSQRALTWSGRRDSNPRPPPWQGGALPTEPRPRVLIHPGSPFRHLQPLPPSAVTRDS